MTQAAPGLSQGAEFLAQQVSAGLVPQRPEGVDWALVCRQVPRAWAREGHPSSFGSMASEAGRVERRLKLLRYKQGATCPCSLPSSHLAKDFSPAEESLAALPQRREVEDKAPDSVLPLGNPTGQTGDAYDGTRGPSN